MSRWRLSIALVSALLFSTLSLAAMAGTVEEVAGDFRPVSGYVVMPSGGEFLIDLDAGKGVREGDLLAVVRPGQKIVHPVSKEVLGTLDEVKGILEVTRLKSGYSYARAVQGEAGIERGDLVRRFENVPAAFWDFQGNGKALAADLQAALPHLEWQGYVRVEGTKPAGFPPLVFALRDGRLEVLGATGRALRSYAVAPPAPASSAQAAVPAPPLSSAPSASGAIVVAPPPAPNPSAIIRKASQQTEGIWMSSELRGEAAGVAVAELDGDGKQEIAVAFPYRLEVGRLAGGKYERLADCDLGYGQKVVGLDSADLDGDGKAELYLTAAADGQLRSQAVIVNGGRCEVVRKDIPWYFRTVRLPGEGDVLLAQEMGRGENDFSGALFRVELKGGKPIAGNRIETPKGTGLYGFAPFRDAENKPIFARINNFDILSVVDPAGETIWQSEEKFGGSEAFIERPDPSKNPATGPATRNAFMQARIEIGDGGELLVPVNEGSRAFSRVRSFDKSRLAALSWNGFALQELWHTRPQEGYLADFRLADADNDGKKELVQALVFSREGMMSKPRSAIAVYELDLRGF